MSEKADNHTAPAVSEVSVGPRAAELSAERRFPSYTLDELLRRAQPGYLIDGFLVEGSLVMVFGRSGEGKTFVLCDVVMALATGRPWQGEHEVKPRKVLVVAAEGGVGLGRRLAAWVVMNGLDPEDFLRVVPTDVQIIRDVDVFLKEIRTFGPDVIVFDPIVECFAGFDENLQKDMTQLVRALRRIQQSRGERPVTVIVVHHSGWDPKHERGSTVLRAAADTVIKVSRTGRQVTMTVEKQRDFEAAEPVVLTLEAVEGKHSEIYVESAVLRRTRSSVSEAPVPLKLEVINALRALASLPGAQGRSKDWERAAGLPNRTFHEYRGWLEERRYVKKLKRGLYEVTAAGQRALGPASAK